MYVVIGTANTAKKNSHPENYLSYKHILGFSFIFTGVEV
jgi:hypothetical protein